MKKPITWDAICFISILILFHETSYKLGLAHAANPIVHYLVFILFIILVIDFTIEFLYEKLVVEQQPLQKFFRKVNKEIKKAQKVNKHNIVVEYDLELEDFQKAIKCFEDKGYSCTPETAGPDPLPKLYIYF